ncbi:hypothetical protein M0D69_37785 [Caballeronia sp. SEWSISQ10-4 2]|uniref:hypothetical protein n=1 Tax=Caballeronia sp. SEWSISQ10-4 2 TaxID=2937438 RepID=UPI00265158EA|nr:hypothetical protein [Caballeronia sp. SEWSISQ10-4 2]MDN7183664.1 hypothetical protein [Caballeronia sp. SEWSISQ10-4 2]
MENIDQTGTKARAPETNAIVERLHKTMLNESCGIAFRGKTMTHSRPLKPIWIHGLNSTTMTVNISGDGAMANPLCAPSSIHPNSSGTN